MRVQGRLRLGAPLAVMALGAAGAAAGSRLLAGAGRLERANYRGRTVCLCGGLGAGLGALAACLGAGPLLRQSGARPTAARAGAVAVLCAASAGLVDDLDAGAHDGQAPAKGLHGHLGALAHGQVTTGVVKIAVIGAGAVAAGALLASDPGQSTSTRSGAAPAARVLDAVGRAVLVASWANLANLLDLRPGRALKACGAAAVPLAACGATRGGGAVASGLLAAGVLGVGVASAPGDLSERTMLGDTGANALGALLGTALAAHPSSRLRAGAQVVGVGLVLASEKVSFSKVIASTPVLAALDALGRPEP